MAVARKTAEPKTAMASKAPKASSTAKTASKTRTTRTKTTAKVAVKSSTAEKSKTTRTRKTPEKTVAKTEPKKRTKAERDVFIEELLKKPTAKADPEFETVEESEYKVKDFIVVLAPNGDVYQEPVPRYCSFDAFCAVIASMPDVPVMNSFTFKADITDTDLGNCHAITNCYDGTRKQNPFAKKFDLRNGTSLIGGNIIFTGDGKPLTKAGADRIAKYVLKTVQSEETFSIDD